MAILTLPQAAEQRLRVLYAAYVLSKRDLACFAEGLIIGMGENPDNWELDTNSMTITSQHDSTSVGASNGTTNQR